MTEWLATVANGFLDKTHFQLAHHHLSSNQLKYRGRTPYVKKCYEIMNSQSSQYFLLGGERCFHVCKASMKGKPQKQENDKSMLLVYTAETPVKVGNIREVQDALKLL